MTRSSRVVLGAVLAVGLTTLTTRAAEPDKLLPAEADTVVQVNVKQILASDIFKKYALEQIKQTLDGKDAKQFLADIGLDPLKDIDKVVIGAEVKGKDDIKYLLIAYGRFDPDKLYKTAEAQSKKDADRFAMIKDGSTVIFKFQPEGSQPPIYGTLIDDQTVIAASDRKMITNAIKAHEGKKKAPIKPELADLVKKVDEKSSVYAVSIVKSKLDDVKIPGGGNLPIDLSGVQKVLAKIETVAVTVKIGSDVNVEATLGMKDDDAAGEMHDVVDKLLQDLKPLAQLAGAAEAKARPLADILATIKTSSQDKDVVISGKVTGANIGKMVKPDDDDK